MSLVPAFTRVCAATVLFAAAAAFGAYLPKGSPAVAGARNIVLIYNSSFDANGVDSHRNWQQADFIPILGYRNAAGYVMTPMFDSVLILPLRAKSGRGFIPGFGTAPSTVDDWTWYANNRLFGGDYHLKHLDDAASQLKSYFNAPNVRLKVFLTIPYPDPAQHSFGAITAGGPNLSFATRANRLAAIQWYMDLVTRLWKTAKFKSIDLVGWYWLQETVGSTDQALLPQVASYVHSTGLKFLWIPYYLAAGYSSWRDWGFDAAIYQPNYFFTLTVPIKRLGDAASGARQYGLGIELELDDRAISDTAYRSRYYDYLKAGRTESFQSDSVTAWYMGGDTLVKCSLSADPAVRAIYDDTYNFIAEAPIPGDAEKNRLLNTRDVATVLGACAGLRRASDSGVSVPGGDVVQDSKLDILDAAKIIRYLAGLQPTLP